MLVYGTAAAVDENNVVTDLTEVWDKALQLNIEQLALSYSVHHRTNFL